MLRYKFANLFAAITIANALPSAATRHASPVVKTTTLENGHVIDWIMRSDDVAEPPSETRGNLSLPPLDGPKGAVPYLRSNLTMPRKVPPPMARSEDTPGRRSTVPTGHEYAYTGESVTTLGGGGIFSLFDPYVNGQDFSLIQTLVGRYNVQSSQYGAIQQTVEAGWQKYPAYSPSAVHFFTYFNTNGYNGDADYVAGYNTDVKGWVQYDNTIYPGYQFTPLSVDGGAQNDVALEYKLVNGNWWLTVNGTYIGYYPASYYNQDTSGTTLAMSGDHVSFYGEIYSSQEDTPTDMGSGEFPSAGYGKSAYIRNLIYTDSSSNEQSYAGQSENDIITNPDSYQLEKHYNSGGSWGSYIFLGGPGYGGQVGS